MCYLAGFILLLLLPHLPTEDARDVFDEPAGLLAVSGMCLSRALKKLYSCKQKQNKNSHFYPLSMQITTCIKRMRLAWTISVRKYFEEVEYVEYSTESCAHTHTRAHVW